MRLKPIGIKVFCVRRLPIYLLVDCSESMVGPPHEALIQGIGLLVSELRRDPVAIETAWISLLTFGRGARTIVPLTEILDFQCPPISISSGTDMGAGLDLLATCIAKDVRKATPTSRGDWRPITFLITDGVPTDNVATASARLKQSNTQLIAIGCGLDIDFELLRSVTPNILSLENATASQFATLFKWISTSVSTASQAIGSGRLHEICLDKTPAGTDAVDRIINSKTSSPSQIILASHCSQHLSNGYLMRYRRETPQSTQYVAEYAYPVGPDYFGEAAGTTGAVIASQDLVGSPNCPYCGNPSWKMDDAGRQLVCCSTQMPEVLNFQGKTLTSDHSDFVSRMTSIKALGGGGNAEESSLDAMVIACEKLTNSNATKAVILVTDQIPYDRDGLNADITPEVVVKALKHAGIGQVHLVLPPKERIRNAYAFIHRELAGKVFDMANAHRSADEFAIVLQSIGQNIHITTQRG